MTVLRSFLLVLSTRPGLGRWLERRPASRRLVRRFVAGRQVEEALEVIADLNARGFGALVTCLGENVTTPAEAGRAADTYLTLLDEIKRRNLRAQPSLKLTHLGLDLGVEQCRAAVARVLERAQAAGTRVWIDMESSAYTERTLGLYAGLRAVYPDVACVVQAYLRRTPADLERLIDLGAAVRLCKGAYREPPGVAYPTRPEVDEAYGRLIDRLLAPDALARRVFPGFATHDERLMARVEARAAERRVTPDRFEFQMLHGIRSDLHRGLAGRGFGLRVLVPFGEDWFGYFMRRLAERPANLLFLLRHLARG